MARALNTDFYQAYRYAVAVGDPASSYIEANAGFNNITIPELSIEASEYREGTYVFTRKQPGIPTVSDATFQKGVSNIAAGGNGKPFFSWILAAINGAEYRSEISIFHLHRGESVEGDSRQIILNECFPIRVKPDGDLDATSGEISIQEMDVAAESIDVVVKAI